MKQKSSPIQRRLMQVMMLTSGSVLLLTSTAFFIYEYYTYRNITKTELSTIGQIVADNSTSSLAFDSKEDAEEILNALKVQRHVIAACLYDKNGKLFACYPVKLNPKDIPVSPPPVGYTFKGKFIEGGQPVIQGEERLGTLYIKSDLKGVYDR